MSRLKEEEAILAVIHQLAEAVNRADSSLAEAVLWLEDERFSQIRDDIPLPSSSPILGSPYHTAFQEIQVHLIPPATAYATALEERSQDGMLKRNHVTFLFLKKGDRWSVLHAHFSAIPQEKGP